jgi:hypothetical protein
VSSKILFSVERKGLSTDSVCNGKKSFRLYAAKVILQIDAVCGATVSTIYLSWIALAASVITTMSEWWKCFFAANLEHTDTRANFNSFMCEIISEYVSWFPHRIIPKKKYLFGNTNNSRANRISMEKYQMNSSKQVITVFERKKIHRDRNFYQIRFTIWILKTFAVLITFASRSTPLGIWRQVPHME